MKYTTEKDQLHNAEIHLTNVAIQKHGMDYNPNHGNKWPLSSFELYIEGVFGTEKAKIMFQKIRELIIHSLLAVQNVILNDKHCFECYGYDIIIDENLKPWLIEVNASPSLSATTKRDRIFKTKLILDVFKVTVPNDFPSTKTSLGGTNWNLNNKIGDFQLLFDELSENNKNENEQSNNYSNLTNSSNFNSNNNNNSNNNASNYKSTLRSKLRSSWR